MMPSGVMQPGCLFEQYLSTMERVRSPQERIAAPQLLSRARPFLQRRWIVPHGHLSHIPVPLFDDEIDVEVEIDEEAGTFSYTPPGYRSRKLTQALEEIAVYSFNVQAWLDDLAGLIGIEPRDRARQPARVPDHLWHLGEARVDGSDDRVPVFVARLWERTPVEALRAVLEDPIWPCGGIVLVLRPVAAEPWHVHAPRVLSDFIGPDDLGHARFDAPAFERVLRSRLASSVPEPEQFLQGLRLRLPHFKQSRELSPERAKILKAMWGVEDKAPPELSWVEVNALANTGYQSFDDAFGGAAAREDVIEKAQRARYRVRRKP